MKRNGLLFILLAIVITCAGCSTIGLVDLCEKTYPSGYSEKITETYADGKTVVIERVFPDGFIEKDIKKAKHRNSFTDKEVGAVKAVVGDVRVQATAYKATVNEDAIKALETPIGSTGTAIGNVVHTAAVGS